MPSFPHFHLIFGVADVNTDIEVTLDKETKLERRELVIADDRFTPKRESWKTEIPPVLNPTPPESFAERALWGGDFNAAIINKITNGQTGEEIMFFREGILGLHVDEITLGHEIVGALAILHPEYASDGFVVLPQTELDDDTTPQADKLRQAIDHAKRRRKPGLSLKKMRPIARDANYKKKLLKYGWNYTRFKIAIQNYALATNYMYRWMGLDVPFDEMRLILYWEYVGQGSIDSKP